MQNFRGLNVWRKGHRLTLQIYKITAGFPQDERFGLTSQLRRACASICANLAEGCCRSSAKDFARFVDMAISSASEVEYFLLLARDLGHVPEPVYASLDEQVWEVKRMLTSLSQRLRSKSASPKLMADG